jgi:hypothetical protein
VPRGAGAAHRSGCNTVFAGGGIAFFGREWLWLRFCRYVHDEAAKRGQELDPAEMIHAARGGRWDPPTERRKITALPVDSTNESPQQKKAS